MLGGFTGLKRLEPGGNSFQSPIPFFHDVVVEEVGNDILNAHLTWQSGTTRVTQVRRDFFEA